MLTDYHSFLPLADLGELLDWVDKYSVDLQLIPAFAKLPKNGLARKTESQLGKVIEHGYIWLSWFLDRECLEKDETAKASIISRYRQLRRLVQDGIAEMPSENRSTGTPRPSKRTETEEDPIEDVLSGQLLTLYRSLKTRGRRTPFDNLAVLDCWRSDEPKDNTIVKALKRLRTELNKFGVSLVIHAKDRRTFLDK